MSEAEKIPRAFKTAWFTKAARKALIKDDTLFEAIWEVWRAKPTILAAGCSRNGWTETGTEASYSGTASV